MMMVTEMDKERFLRRMKTDIEIYCRGVCRQMGVVPDVCIGQCKVDEIYNRIVALVGQ